MVDEPTSALDPISTSKIEDLAMELKKDYTIVITCSRQCVCLTIRRFSFSEKLWNTTIQKNCFQYRKIKRQKITLREDLVN